MEKVNQDPFSSGEDFRWWTERNCNRCVKSLKSLTATNFRCTIERDIVTRMFSNEPIAKRTIDVCRKADCPCRKEHYPKRKTKNDNQPELF